MFLHIGSLGAISMNAGELEDFRYVRVSDTVETIERNRDLIVGIKARLGTDPCGPNIMAALDATLEAADATDLPAIVHISGGADLRQILPRLRSGDIVTHTFIADDGGLIFGGGNDDPARGPGRAGAGRRLRRRPRLRLVLVGDVPPRDRAGLPRCDTISTDLHRLCVEGPVFDMLTTMSKFLHGGMSIPDIVAASTTTPARAIRTGRHDRVPGRRPTRRHRRLPH